MSDYSPPGDFQSVFDEHTRIFEPDTPKDVELQQLRSLAFDKLLWSEERLDEHVLQAGSTMLQLHRETMALNHDLLQQMPPHVQRASEDCQVH